MTLTPTASQVATPGLNLRNNRLTDQRTDRQRILTPTASWVARPHHAAVVLLQADSLGGAVHGKAVVALDGADRAQVMGAALKVAVDRVSQVVAHQD